MLTTTIVVESMPPRHLAFFTGGMLVPTFVGISMFHTLCSVRMAHPTSPCVASTPRSWLPIRLRVTIYCDRNFKFLEFYGFPCIFLLGYR